MALSVIARIREIDLPLRPGMPGIPRFVLAAALISIAPRALALERYNVLQVVWDTTRADHLGAYGYPRETTPHLDARLDEAVLVERCSSAGTWTVPSVASLLTGLSVETHKMFTQAIRLDDAWTTVPELLTAEGYRCAIFSANPVVLDLDRNLDQGTEESQWMTRPDSLVTRSFFDFLDVSDGRPFFAHLQYYGSHGPYVPIEPFDSLFVGDEFYDQLGDAPGIAQQSCEEGIPATVAQDSILDMDYYVDQYDALIAQSDHELNRLFDGLNARGLLDSTLIVLTADHGELLGGEHGRYFCHTTVYEGNIHVPLVFWLPPAWQEVHGRVGGVRITSDVSLIDVAPTILTFLGLPVPWEMQGKAIQVGGIRPPVSTHDAADRAGRRGTDKLIHGGAALELSAHIERFDLAHDPAEAHNVAIEDSALTRSMATALLDRSQEWRAIDPDWSADSLFVSEDFEGGERSEGRLFRGARNREIWDWQVIEEPMRPGNHVLYGYAADTVNVGPEQWLTGTCAYLDSPRRSTEVSFGLWLHSGVAIIRSAWLAWLKSGYEARLSPQEVELIARVPGDDPVVLGTATGVLTAGRWHRVTLRSAGPVIQLGVDGRLVISGYVPDWTECFGTVEFALGATGSRFLVDDLEIRGPGSGKSSRLD